MGRILIVYAAGMSGFFTGQVVLWLLQPPGCSPGDLFAGRTGCGAGYILIVLHMIAALLVGMLTIDATVWILERRETAKRRRSE